MEYGLKPFKPLFGPGVGWGARRATTAVPRPRAGRGGVRGRRVVTWGVGVTYRSTLHAILKMGLMLKGLYGFKPSDLAPKRALLGAIFTDFEKFGHGGGLRSRADAMVPSPGSISGRYVRSR